jgi:hypothetical protein
MTAEAVEDVWPRTRGRDWTWAALAVELAGAGTPSVTVHELSGTAYREVTTVAAGSAAVVEVPFRVELRPAELAGPRRRA